ncbi:MAG TPA: MFS transporter, partial [Rhizomicrobium sp.]
MSSAATRPTRVRHTVLTLVVLVYFVTYLDRVLLSNALPVIQKQFHFSIGTLGLILGCYNWAYALFQIPGGWFGDRAGPRIALASVVIWWSVFTFITGFSTSVTMLMVCLFLIGMGEAGAFPISNRALSRWMLPTERGFAQGSTHAGSRLAGAAAPILVATLIGLYSWHTPFFLFATLGVIWAAVWIWYYRDAPSEHASVNEGERQKIVSAIGEAKKR